MKYDFAVKLFQGYNFLYTIESKSNEFRGEHEFVYDIIISKRYKFKRMCPNLDTKVLDILTDEVLLKYKPFGQDANNLRKMFKKVFRQLTVYDYKVLHKFRLFIEKEMTNAADIEELRADSQVTIKGDNFEFITAGLLLILLMLSIEGGILYEYFNVRNITMNLGKDLDNLVDKRIPAEQRRTLMLYDNMSLLAAEYLDINLAKGIGVGKSTEIGNKLLENIKNESSNLFGNWYIFLLDLCFGLHNESTRKVIESYISENTFKFNLINALGFSDYNTSLVHRYVLDDNVHEAFYSREVLLPSSGVEITFKDADYAKAKTSVCECDDEVFGRNIFIFTLDDSNYYFCCKSLYLDLKIGSFDQLPNGMSPVFDVYNIRNEFNSVATFTELAVELNQKESRLNRNKKETVLEELEYTVYIPTHWRYKNQNKQVQKEFNPNTECSALYGKELKNIKPFTRPLANGHQRSINAEQLAKQLCIKLKPGTTLVSEFERMQRVRLDKAK